MTITAKKQATMDKLCQEDAVIAEAMSILEGRMRKGDVLLSSPNAIKQYLICRLGQHEREMFGVLWLDTKNRLIEFEVLFFGTLTQCAVYPREVVKSGLRLNAAAACLSHQHPSSFDPTPSEADHLLTRALKEALALVDIRVLDHIVVGGTRTHSFAEHGQI